MRRVSWLACMVWALWGPVCLLTSEASAAPSTKRRTSAKKKKKSQSTKPLRPSEAPARTANPIPPDPEPAVDTPSEPETLSPQKQEIEAQQDLTSSSSSTPPLDRPLSEHESLEGCQEEELFGSAATPTVETEESPEPSPELKKDPLVVSARLVLAFLGDGSDNTSVKDIAVHAPNFLDVSLDSTLVEHVRAMLVTRLLYDPLTLVTSTKTVTSANVAPQGAFQQPSLLIDQLWVKWELNDWIFATVGRQHIKWGVGRLWSPADFIYPLTRNPFAFFDERLGSTGIKIHIPINTWNFYILGMFDVPAAAFTLKNVSVALRAEAVLWGAEVALSTIFQEENHFRFGTDISLPLGPLDVYGELTVEKARGVQWSRSANPSLFPLYSDSIVATPRSGLYARGVIGASWDAAFLDTGLFTLGAELYLNSQGYSDATLYPWLLSRGNFQPLYIGARYVGGYALVTLPKPWNLWSGSMRTAFNLADGSGIVQMEVSRRLGLIANAAVFGQYHMGAVGTELRYGGDIPDIRLDSGEVLPAYYVAPPRFSVGLRLSVFF